MFLILYRFNEWGQAVWKQQLEKLQAQGAGKPDMLFLGFPVMDEEKIDCPSLKLGNNFKGLVMQDPLLAHYNWITGVFNEVCNFENHRLNNGSVDGL